MPVVGMQDDWTRDQSRECSDGGQGKKREPAGVVRIVDSILAVDTRAIEIVEMLHEENLRAGSGTCHPEDASFLRVGAHGHQERLAYGFKVRIGVSDGAVQR